MKKKELVDKKGEIEIQGGDDRSGSSGVERQDTERRDEHQRIRVKNQPREGAKQETEPSPCGWRDGRKEA